MIQFTSEQMADLIAVAYSRANADGVVTAEELTRELALASQELATAEMRKRRASLLAAPPMLFVGTATPVGDVVEVKAWQAEKESAQAKACKDKLKQNVAVIEGAGAVLTAVGTSLVTGGVTLPAAGLALLPMATAVLDYLSSDDGEAPVFEVPVFTAASGLGKSGMEVLLPTIKAGGGGAVEVLRRIDGVVDFARPGGSGTAASAEPRGPREHHGNPHHGNPHHGVPLKPGHKDTTGHHSG